MTKKADHVTGKGDHVTISADHRCYLEDAVTSLQPACPSCHTIWSDLSTTARTQTINIAQQILQQTKVEHRLQC